MSVPDALTRHVPQTAAAYCIELWQLGKFSLRITKDRQTKLGDYTFDPKNGQHTISVNQGLNRYAFLITYLHEVAHLVTQLRFGVSVKPHGIEWQSAFKEIVFPVATTDVFPEEILRALFRHMKTPAASSCSDLQLQKVLHAYDSDAADFVFVEELMVNQQFQIKKDIYRVIEKSLKKSICIQESNQKKYYVPHVMRVKKVKP